MGLPERPSLAILLPLRFLPKKGRLMSEPLDLDSRMTALEIFVIRWIIVQLRGIDASQAGGRANELIDTLEHQLAEILATIGESGEAAAAKARRVDEGVGHLMGLLRTQFR